MKKFMDILARIPRFWLFVAAGGLQVVLIALMVGDRARILRTGTEITLKTVAVDPRDLLRGDYVVLNYEISSVQTGDLSGTPAPKGDYFVYVKLAPAADGFHRAVSLHRERVPVAAGEVLIRGRINRGQNCGEQSSQFCPTMRLDYGLESFFVPQGEGRDLEQARNQGKLAVVAAVTPGGRAAIKRLMLDGKPVYDEPLF
jgi:uncharacterized membrane-anchored protein